MNSQDPASFDAHAVTNPEMDTQTLTWLAHVRPDLRPAIALNPNADQAILASLQRHVVPPPTPPAFSRGSTAPKPTSQQWSEDFQRRMGRGPTVADFNNAVKAGEVAPEYTNSAGQQFAAGAKNLGKSATAFFAGAASRGGAAVTQAANPHTPTGVQPLGRQTGPVSFETKLRRTLFTLCGVSIAGLISMMFPMAEFRFDILGIVNAGAVDFFFGDFAFFGMIFLVILLSLLGLTVWELRQPRRTLRISLGSLGACGGLLIFISAIVINNHFNRSPDLSSMSEDDAWAAAVIAGAVETGSGTVMLMFVSVVMICASGYFLYLLNVGGELKNLRFVRRAAAVAPVQAFQPGMQNPHTFAQPSTYSQPYPDQSAFQPSSFPSTNPGYEMGSGVSGTDFRADTPAPEVSEHTTSEVKNDGTEASTSGQDTTTSQLGDEAESSSKTE